MSGPTPRLRPAIADDSEPCFRLFWASISDLADRLGTPWSQTADELWPRFTDLYALLAEIAAEWWIADDPDTGDIIGYARSVERGAGGGLFELSEFFVRPTRQAGGVGRQLLDRAFPIRRGKRRAIIATGDPRALSRYHRADTTVQFPIFGLTGRPSPDAAADIGLEAERMEAEQIDVVAALERSVLGYERGTAELRWLFDRREGWRYRRDGETVGTAFVGRDGAGPISATEPELLPAILRHVESRSAGLGREELALDVPAPAVTAIRHLLGRGFRFDPFVTYLMADRPFGRFDRYLGFQPPFVL